MAKKVLTIKKGTDENIPVTEKKEKKILVVKNEKEKIQEKINNKTEALNERIADVSETERQEKATAKKISETLQDIVDTQNNNAKGYLKDFQEWLEEKFNHKIRKKYFPGKTKEDILILATKDKDTKIQLSNYRKECEKTKRKERIEIRNEKLRIFEAIKRAFNKNIAGHKWTDIDKESGLKLLQLAKFFTDAKGEKVNYTVHDLENQERAKNGVQYDSWGTRNGMEIIPNRQTIRNGKSEGKTYQSLFNALTIMDEHNKSDWAKNVMKPTSSTHIIYTLLDELQAFNPKYKGQIKRFIDFVDKVDSLYYQFGGKDQNANKRTLFHNHKLINNQKIYEYFQDKTKTGFEILSDEELKNLWIVDIAYNEKRNEKGIKKLQKLEEKGRFGNLNEQKFIFAVGREFTGGQEISSYYDSGLVQMFESGDLYIYSPKPLPKTINGFSTNGNFLIIKNVSSEDLEKILDSFDFNPKYSDPLLKKTFLNYQKECEEAKIKAAKKEKENSDEYKEMIQKEIQTLKEKKVKIGEIVTGIINNISWKIMYINITPTLVGTIKNETKKTQLKTGEKIKVKVVSIPEKEEKKYIPLEMVV